MMMRILSVAAIFVGVINIATAQPTTPVVHTSAVATKPVAYRGSTFTYENTFSAYSLSKSAQLTYDAYYAQVFTLRPRYYFTDDLRLQGRLDLEIELTTSDDADSAHQPLFSDLQLEPVYAPAWAKIPYVNVMVETSLRMSLPMSIVSQNRSLIMSIAPDLKLKRVFEFNRAKYFKDLTLSYDIRVGKNFNQYAEMSRTAVDSICANVSRPECMHVGTRNVSWRFVNTLLAQLSIMPKLSFTASLSFINDRLYGLDAQTVTLDGGATVRVPESTVNHSAKLWAVFDLTYELFDWLHVAGGASTYHGQLAADSSYQTPFFNRYTNFYVDLIVPIDGAVDRIKKFAQK